MSAAVAIDGVLPALESLGFQAVTARDGCAPNGATHVRHFDDMHSLWFCHYDPTDPEQYGVEFTGCTRRCDCLDARVPQECFNLSSLCVALDMADDHATEFAMGDRY